MGRINTYVRPMNCVPTLMKRRDKQNYRRGRQDTRRVDRSCSHFTGGDAFDVREHGPSTYG